MKQIISFHAFKFYSHVICLGTKIHCNAGDERIVFYSHVICLGTKMKQIISFHAFKFYSHVICLGTKIPNMLFAIAVGFTVT